MTIPEEVNNQRFNVNCDTFDLKQQSKTTMNSGSERRKASYNIVFKKPYFLFFFVMKN